MKGPTGEEIVRELVTRRVQARMTQEHVATLCGVSRATIARFETHCLRTRTPSLFVLSRYAKAVGARITVIDA